MKKIIFTLIAGLLSVQLWALNAENASLNFGRSVCFFQLEKNEGDYIQDDFKCVDEEELITFYYADKERAKQSFDGVLEMLKEKYLKQNQEEETLEDGTVLFVGHDDEEVVALRLFPSALAVFIGKATPQNPRAEIGNYMASLDIPEKPFVAALDESL